MLRIALQESLQGLEVLRTTNEDVRATLETQKENEGELKQLKLLQQNKLKEQESEKHLYCGSRKVKRKNIRT